MRNPLFVLLWICGDLNYSFSNDRFSGIAYSAIGQNLALNVFEVKPILGVHKMAEAVCYAQTTPVSETGGLLIIPHLNGVLFAVLIL